jgi:hypothetical protein
MHQRHWDKSTTEILNSDNWTKTIRINNNTEKVLKNMKSRRVNIHEAGWKKDPIPSTHVLRKSFN